MPQHLTEKRREFTTRRDLLKSALRLTGAGLLSSALLTKAGLADAEVDAVTVQILSGDISVGAFLAKPRTGGSSPAVIVIHDAQGLNDQIPDEWLRGFSFCEGPLLSQLYRHSFADRCALFGRLI